MSEFVAPLEVSAELSDSLGKLVLIKREDLFPLFGGGSKGRKTAALHGELMRALPGAIGSVGGLQSNHLRSSAELAKLLSIPFDAVVHNASPRTVLPAHLRSCRRLLICNAADVSSAIRDLISTAPERDFVFVPGGGHHLPGALAYSEVGRELAKQLTSFGVHRARVLVPSGTGATQAGLIHGLADTPHHVTGVSVGRQRPQGVRGVREALSWLGGPRHSICFDTEGFTGYGIYSDELRRVTALYSSALGLALDPQYVGRAFLALDRIASRGASHNVFDAYVVVMTDVLRTEPEVPL